MKSQEKDKAATFPTAAHKLPGTGRSSGLRAFPPLVSYPGEQWHIVPSTREIQIQGASCKKQPSAKGKMQLW